MKKESPMWKLNDVGLNAVENSIARRVKFGMKPEAWLEDAEEEANRAWEDPEWTHREAEIEILPVYCKDGRAHVVPLYPSWFDWHETAGAAKNVRESETA